MSKEIMLPLKHRKEIADAFGVEHKEVGRALTHEINSDRAKMMRGMAWSKGARPFTGKPVDKKSEEYKQFNT